MLIYFPEHTFVHNPFTMKKFCTNLVALVALFSAYAQNPFRIHNDIWTEEGWYELGYVDYNYTDDRLSSIVLYGESSPSEWEKAYEEIYTYNSSGLLTEKFSRMKIEFEENWIDYMRTTYEYDESGRLKSHLFEEFTINIYDEWVWQPFDRVFYEYDSAGLKISQTTQIWSPSHPWYTDRSSHYSYDSNNVLISELLKMYVTDTIGTENSLINYFYTGNNLLERIERNVATETGWVPYEKEQRIYNTQDSIIQAIFSVWDEESGQYLSKTQDLYTYDTPGLLVVKITQNYTDDDWVNYRRYRYEYQISTKMKENQIKFHIYPNPASDMINIRFEETSNKNIEIIDMQGRIMYSLNTHETQASLPVSHLPAQMYLIRIQDRGLIQTLRWLKH